MKKMLTRMLGSVVGISLCLTIAPISAADAATKPRTGKKPPVRANSRPNVNNSHNRPRPPANNNHNRPNNNRPNNNRPGGHNNNNVNINVDRNVNVHGGYGYNDHYRYHDWDDDWDDHWHPVATMATAAATAAIVGSIVRSVPPDCSTVVVNGIGYSQCGNTWYQPQYVGSSVQYVVVNPPR